MLGRLGKCLYHLILSVALMGSNFMGGVCSVLCQRLTATRSDAVVACPAVLFSCRYAATRGDTVKLRSMLQQGFNPDSSDYDGRTALMLACVRGHRDVVDLLLSAGGWGFSCLQSATR